MCASAGVEPGCADRAAPSQEKVPAGVLTLTTGQRRHWSVGQARLLIGQDTSGQRRLGSDWSGHWWSEGCGHLIGQDISGHWVRST